MTSILSNTAAPVSIQELPEYAQYVTYKLLPKEITFYYWMKDVVCKHNFYDPEERELTFGYNDFNSYRTDSYTAGFYPYRNTFYPRNGRAETIQQSLQTAKDHNLKNIVFSCVACASVSLNTFDLTDIVRFYGIDFSLSSDEKSVISTRLYGLPNTSNGRVCWGNRDDLGAGNGYSIRSVDGTVKGKINTFLGTAFNHDYVSLPEFVERISDAKQQEKSGNNIKSELFLNGDDYNSFITVNFKTQPVAYFRLFAAGFRPLNSTSRVMLIPTKSGSIDYDGTEYFGYFTEEDALGKSWFVNNTGHLLGQVDS
jgi:hypothetical protein